MAEVHSFEGRSAADVLKGAELTPIAQLHPAISDPESRAVDGVITVTWPYSIVVKSVAFILVEHDVRLRRERGQLRVELHGAAATAFADSGVGGGDEIRVSLAHVAWEKQSTQTRVPGTLLDWQLKFTSRILLQFRKTDSEEESGIIDIYEPDEGTSVLPELDQDTNPPQPRIQTPSPDIATPQPRSPISSHPAKRLASATFEPDEYASPAFIKRARVSYGSLFEGGFDIDGDEARNGKRKKKSRFSMNHASWKYSSRSPSPEVDQRSEPGVEEVDTSVGSAEAPPTVEAPSATPSRQPMVDEGCQTQDLQFSPSMGVQVLAESRLTGSIYQSSPTPVMSASHSFEGNDALFQSPLHPLFGHGQGHHDVLRPEIDSTATHAVAPLHSDQGFGFGISDPILTNPLATSDATAASGLFATQEAPQETGYPTTTLDHSRFHTPADASGQSSPFASHAHSQNEAIYSMPEPRDVTWQTSSLDMQYSPYTDLHAQNEAQNPIEIPDSPELAARGPAAQFLASQFAGGLEPTEQRHEGPYQELPRQESAGPIYNDQDAALENHYHPNLYTPTYNDARDPEEEEIASRGSVAREEIANHDQTHDDAKSVEDDDLESAEGSYESEEGPEYDAPTKGSGSDMAHDDDGEEYDEEDEYSEETDEEGDEPGPAPVPQAPQQPVFISLLSDSEDEEGDEDASGPPPQHSTAPSQLDGSGDDFQPSFAVREAKRTEHAITSTSAVSPTSKSGGVPFAPVEKATDAEEAEAEAEENEEDAEEEVGGEEEEEPKVRRLKLPARESHNRVLALGSSPPPEQESAPGLPTDDHEGAHLRDESDERDGSDLPQNAASTMEEQVETAQMLTEFASHAQSEATRVDAAADVNMSSNKATVSSGTGLPVADLDNNHGNQEQSGDGAPGSPGKEAAEPQKSVEAEDAIMDDAVEDLSMEKNEISRPGDSLEEDFTRATPTSSLEPTEEVDEAIGAEAQSHYSHTSAELRGAVVPVDEETTGQEPDSMETQEEDETTLSAQAELQLTREHVQDMVPDQDAGSGSTNRAKTPNIDKANQENDAAEELEIPIKVQSLRSRNQRRMRQSDAAPSGSPADPSVSLAKVPASTPAVEHAHEDSSPTTMRVTRSQTDNAEQKSAPSSQRGSSPPVMVRITRSKADHPDPSVHLAKASPKKTRRQVTPEITRESHPRTPPQAHRQGDGQDATADVLKSPSVTESVTEDQKVSALKVQLLKTLRTKLPDCLPLRSLRSSLMQVADILAVATTTPPLPHRPKSGPRDYMLELILTDPSVASSGVNVAHIFRPHQASLPVVHAGDVVLLRHVQVVSMKGRGFGVRVGDASAWAVFEKDDEEMLPQIKGPPVEVVDEEVEYAQGLRRWRAMLDDKALAKLERASQKALQASKDDLR